MEMRQFNLILLLLVLLCGSAQGAAPTRSYNYVSHTTIDPTQNNTNENSLYSYLQAGVDTYSSGSITNDAISGSAAISYSKLNLLGSITSNDIVDGAIVNADINGSAAIVASKLDLTSPGAIGSASANTGSFTTLLSSGNVGVGTTVINAGRLLVSGGNVGVGTTHPNVALDVIGQIRPSTGILFGDGTTQTTMPPNTFKFISKTSLSGVATSGNIAITNTSWYKVTYNFHDASGADQIQIAFNADTGSNYKYAFNGRTSGGAITGGSASATAISPMTDAVINGNNQISGEFNIFPSATNGIVYIQGKTVYLNNAASLITIIEYGGYWTNSATATSFLIKTAGGQTVTGDINLYQLQQL